mmetsp:Transcript_98095/g.299937  ORF Transcript_98095/g.299937 Transcript_98095/m.299937 type:complete len:207 (+) Transcript_98095:619-1239(+)
MSSNNLASDSWSKYTPVKCTVHVLIRNSFFFLSMASRGMRKSGTRRCISWRCWGAEWSSSVFRPSLIKWSIVSSSSVSGMGAHRPHCTPPPFPRFAPSLPLSTDSRSRAWYTSWYSNSTLREYMAVEPWMSSAASAKFSWLALSLGSVTTSCETSSMYFSSSSAISIFQTFDRSRIGCSRCAKRVVGSAAIACTPDGSYALMGSLR